MTHREPDYDVQSSSKEHNGENTFRPGSNILIEGQPVQSLKYMFTYNVKKPHVNGVVLLENTNQLSAVLPFVDGLTPPLICIDDNRIDDTPRQFALPIEDRSIAELGRSIFLALEGSKAPSCDTVCVPELATLLEWDSVQGVYRLLYLLSKRISATRKLAFYSLDSSSDPKTKRILQQPMDYWVTFDESGAPLITSLRNAQNSTN